MRGKSNRRKHALVKFRQSAKGWLPPFYGGDNKKAWIISRVPNQDLAQPRTFKLWLPVKNLVFNIYQKPQISGKTYKRQWLRIPLLDKEVVIWRTTWLDKKPAPAPKKPAAKGPVTKPKKAHDFKWAFSRVLISLGLIGSAWFGYQIASDYEANQPDTVQSIPAPVQVFAQKEASLPRSVPKSLQIPAIGLNTSLIELGKNRDGTLGTPERYDIAGWYKYSPTPGEIGPAIIVGHVDTYRGAAVFYRLRELKKGQTILVKRKDGKTVKFKVDAVRLFDQDHFPTAQVYGNLDYAGLRLITCGGTFNHSTHQYEANTVVFASEVK